MATTKLLQMFADVVHTQKHWRRCRRTSRTMSKFAREIFCRSNGPNEGRMECIGGRTNECIDERTNALANERMHWQMNECIGKRTNALTNERMHEDDIREDLYNRMLDSSAICRNKWTSYLDKDAIKFLLRNIKGQLMMRDARVARVLQRDFGRKEWQ